MREKILSIFRARLSLLELIRGFAETSDRWIITKDGKLEAVLLSYEDYDALMETVDILGDSSLVTELNRREKEMKEGKTGTKTHQEVFEDTD